MRKLHQQVEVSAAPPVVAEHMLEPVPAVFLDVEARLNVPPPAPPCDDLRGARRAGDECPSVPFGHFHRVAVHLVGVRGTPLLERQDELPAVATADAHDLGAGVELDRIARDDDIRLRHRAIEDALPPAQRPDARKFSLYSSVQVG